MIFIEISVVEWFSDYRLNKIGQLLKKDKNGSGTRYVLCEVGSDDVINYSDFGLVDFLKEKGDKLSGEQ